MKTGYPVFSSEVSLVFEKNFDKFWLEPRLKLEDYLVVHVWWCGFHFIREPKKQ